ncbi:MAG: hypothetical protein AAGE85_06900 [Pseudomonadota bacterium]
MTIFGSIRPERVALLLLASASSSPAADTELDGHVKVRLLASSFSSDSLIADLAGSEALDLESDLRLNLRWRDGGWSLEGSGQLFALHGERIEYTRRFPPELGFLPPRLPDDERRLFDLTTVMSDSGKTATLARFDRLALAWTGEKTVLRFGRQALSWGNGLFYAPMDLVNPFDPATIDTEFKVGDDMLYGQYLKDNGNDLQAALVLRRDPLTGRVENDQATLAFKYHGLAGTSEYDVLLARHYGDPVLGFGGSQGIGGAIWRGDLVLTRTGGRNYVQLVSSLNYSWTAFSKNVTGGIEYYFSEFGADRDYVLAEQPELLARLARSELFTLGRQYLATTLTVELSPLWTLTPLVLTNLQDPSALLQVTAQGSLSDDAIFIGTLSMPLGPAGTEFGGIDSGVPGRSLASGVSLFLQFAWYF